MRKGLLLLGVGIKKDTQEIKGLKVLNDFSGSRLRARNWLTVDKK